MSDAFDAGAELRDVFIDESADHAGLAERLQAGGVPVRPVGRDVIKALTETVTPQGVVAVASDPTAELDSLGDADLVLVLADVRDPGNAGTLVRSAMAAGASGVVFAKGSVDPLHPKVVRSAAATLFWLPVVRGVDLLEALDFLKENSVSLVGSSAASEDSVYQADLTSRLALVLGNEAWGLPPDVERAMDKVVGIPMPGPAESLNVSVAGAILLFEALRQRRAATGDPPSPGLSSATND